MKIDVHAHFYPRAYLEEAVRLYKDDTSAGGRDTNRVLSWALTDPRMSSVEQRLEDMDNFSVDMQVLSLSIPNVYFSDRAAAVGVCQIANDAYIEMARAHPGRFRVFASVPLHFPEAAVDELDRIAGRPEVVGVVLGANVNSEPLNRPDFLAFYGELEKRNLPFFMHPMRPPGVEWMMEFNLAPTCGYLFDSTLATLRLVFNGVFEKHPDLVLIMPHLGAVAPYMLGRVRWAYNRHEVCRTHISQPPETFFQRFYYDTVCHWVPALRYACSLFGTEHICFGTDYPFNHDVEEQSQGIEEIGLSPEEEAKIFSGNAARLFNLVPAK